MIAFFKQRLNFSSTKILGLYLFIVFALPAYSQINNIASWPDIKLPRKLQTFPMGSDVNANGVPMRMQGFTSALPVAEVIEALRDSLGQPLVMNQIGKQVVVGRALGAFYVTVQIEAEGAGSRGVVATTDMQSAVDNKEFTQQEKQRWLDQLPAGSRLMSHVKSSDNSKRSVQLVYTNEQNSAINADRLKAMLTREGLSLEREGAADNATKSGTNMVEQGQVLFFKGVAKEAIATIHRQIDGQTFTVLNIINTSERLK
jgi:hypothetical protein